MSESILEVVDEAEDGAEREPVIEESLRILNGSSGFGV